MANEKKYFSVINDGTEDIYVKDDEARALIPSIASIAEATAAANELT